ncbi:MAG: hypothetical protein COA41_07160 [Sphingopyxis sp.]|nr:MAG: hypothetical protein COA41_07160 [Sphingopyxis sp.]
MTIKRLPQFAEHYFASACSKAGVVCNPSLEDECGWDFHLQFPSDDRPGLPADMRTAPPEAFVQVKSKLKTPLVAKLKLSNALQASLSSQPHFLVLVIKDAQTDSVRFYAKHFWEPEITRSLKRVREAESKGNFTLNRRYISFSFRPEDEHTDDLCEWMQSVIRKQGKNYSEEKTKLSTTVGFGNEFGEMQFSITADVKDLEDWQIGLKKELPVNSMEITSKRFGIPLPMQPEKFLGGVVSVDTSAGPCQLRLQGGSPTTELVLEGELFGLPLPPSHSGENRWRVEAGPLRIIGGTKSHRSTASLDFAEKKSLRALYEYLQIFAWGKHGKVGMQLVHDGQKIPMGHLEFDAKPSWDCSPVLPLMTTLRKIETIDGANDALFSFNEIIESYAQLETFSKLIESTSLEIHYEPIEEDDPIRAMLFSIGCNVGDKSFLAIVERTTHSDNMDSKRRKIAFRHPRLLDGMIREGSSQNHKADMKSALDEQADRLGDKDTLWEIHDIFEFIENNRKPN